MDRIERKIKTSYIIIFLVYISIITALTYFTVNTNIKLKDLSTIKNNNNETLSKLKNDLNQLEEKEEILLNDIDNLNNIDENTLEIKKQVFELAGKLEEKIKNGNTEYKIAYLTFDDGPYYLTNSFLDILDKYNVKATFFTIGFDKDWCFDNRSQDCSMMYKKIVDKGHTIANHTYSHSIFNGLYSSAEAFIYDLKAQEEIIKNKTGVITNIMRFPGGSAQARNLKNSIINKLKENNYGWVDWTAMNGDGKYISTKQEGLNNLKNSIDENIEVILFHDYNYVTLSMLPEAIEYLQSKNYILLPLFYESTMVNK